MTGYLAKRIAALGGLLLVASLVVFALMQFVPGDPAVLILRERRGGEAPEPQAVRALRHELGLDLPAPVRYVRWLGGVATGHLGYSFRNGEPVAAALAPRLARTLILGTAAGGLALLLSLLWGVSTAARPRGLWNRVSLLLAALLAATPVFVLGLVLALVFSLALGVLPAAGNETPAHYILPVLTLGLAATPVSARVLQRSLRAELSAAYVTAARARGVPEDRVLYVHALRNALLPWLTVGGLVLRGLLAGAVLVETVFDFDGLGRFLVDAVSIRDVPVLQAGILVFVTITVLVNLLTDLGYAALDPRVRLAGGVA